MIGESENFVSRRCCYYDLRSRRSRGNRFAALAMADELDSIGGYWRPNAPSSLQAPPAKFATPFLGPGTREMRFFRSIFHE